MNLARAGYGEWTQIDPDELLPHNLVKHELTGRDVGRPKVEALAEVANETIDGAPVATPIVADVLAPGKHEETIQEAFKNADAVLDTSASVAVAPSSAEHRLARPAGFALLQSLRHRWRYVVRGFCP